MDFEPTLHKIDAEIAKLQLIRDIVQRLERPSPSPKTKRKTISAPVEVIAPTPTPTPEPVQAAPSVHVLPPRIRREYHPRTKHAAADQRALAPARSDRPVFVPRASAPAPTPVAKQDLPNAQTLEALVRSHLLGTAVHAER